ncbi:SecDF P1 head subdomain-containing protein [Rhabdothermincola sp.]|uniref:SecDF P1 head subdomain-containing protein n=1 Tax=Rhabdothermincola sp. TaxID=2820405 RepID=UPI002FE4252D
MRLTLLAVLVMTGAVACGGTSDHPGEQAGTVTTLTAEERVIRFRVDGDQVGAPPLAPIAATVADRLRRSGMNGADVSVDGQTLVIQLPEGSTPTARRLVDTVTAVGELAFRPVLAESSTGGATPITGIPTVGPDGSPLVLGPPVLENGIASATAAAEAGGWVVVPRFNVDLSPLLDAVGACIERQAICPTGKMAIVIDDRVVSVGQIDPSLRRVVITGSFDEFEAKGLAAVLSTGPLPVRLVPAR